jgi:integrase/recombinase XerD
MISRPTISTVLNKKYVKADGSCGISLRITYLRKKKFFGLPINLTAEEYDRAMGEKPRGKYKELALEIAAYETKAKSIVDSMPSFSWEKFEMLFFSNRKSQKDVYSAFEDYINKLKIEKRPGTASSCQCALNSLKLFRKELHFVDIDKNFLYKYEVWMLERGKSKTTIGFYLRALRTIYNSAIQNGFISPESSPFRRGQYIIPMSRNPKRALLEDDLKKIANYKFSDESLRRRSRDLWLFMYRANGMNVKDMALLKYGDIKEDFIEFERAKTKRTKRTLNKIRVHITQELWALIKKWGNVKQTDETYLFPILEKGISVERQRVIIQQATRLINKHMKDLGRELDVQQKISTQTARHSYATTLMRHGFTPHFIGGQMGHADIKTTQNYFADYADEIHKNAAGVLSGIICREDEK